MKQITFDTHEKKAEKYSIQSYFLNWFEIAFFGLFILAACEI